MRRIAVLLLARRRDRHRADRSTASRCVSDQSPAAPSDLDGERDGLGQRDVGARDPVDADQLVPASGRLRAERRQRRAHDSGRERGGRAEYADAAADHDRGFGRSHGEHPDQHGHLLRRRRRDDDRWGTWIRSRRRWIRAHRRRSTWAPNGTARSTRPTRCRTIHGRS